MKKYLSVLSVLAAFLLLCLTALPAQASQDALFKQQHQWERNGYPDDIGGIYILGDGNTYGLLLVDPTPAREAQLRAGLGGEMVITRAEYSYNELYAVKEEIAAEMRPGSMIYAVGVDCRVRGYVDPGVTRGGGFSGSEVRVIVNADARVLDKYTEEFARRYGDKVHVMTLPDSNYNYWQQQWEEQGYPDDIGGFYREGSGALVLQVVDPGPERAEELREMFGDALRISPTKYSYNELERVQAEIVASYMGQPDSKVYAAGTGWSSDEDGVFGFGESGCEFRVVVTVDESAFEHYGEEFQRLYGDMVFLNAGGPFTYLDFDEAGAPPTIAEPANLRWALPMLPGAVLLALCVVLLLRRKKSKI